VRLDCYGVRASSVSDSGKVALGAGRKSVRWKYFKPLDRRLTFTMADYRRMVRAHHNGHLLTMKEQGRLLAALGRKVPLSD
jgi:hypothetical protein